MCDPPPGECSGVPAVPGWGRAKRESRRRPSRSPQRPGSTIVSCRGRRPANRSSSRRYHQDSSTAFPTRTSGRSPPSSASPCCSSATTRTGEQNSMLSPHTFKMTNIGVDVQQCDAQCSEESDGPVGSKSPPDHDHQLSLNTHGGASMSTASAATDVGPPKCCRPQPAALPHHVPRCHHHRHQAGLAVRLGGLPVRCRRRLGGGGTELETGAERHTPRARPRRLRPLAGVSPLS
jgi:hypothetical protein